MVKKMEKVLLKKNKIILSIIRSNIKMIIKMKYKKHMFKAFFSSFYVCLGLKILNDFYNLHINY
jgi:hypothetical protein